MSNETDSFIQEVDANLRQDRALTLVKRFAPWLGVLLIVFVAAAGGWQWQQGEAVKAARQQADAFAAAQSLTRAGNLEDAGAAFDQLTTEGPAVYRLMARMERAAILQQSGDLDGALAGFDAAAEAARDPIMKASAQLRAAYIAAETQDFAALRVRVQPIIDGGGPLGVLAQELLAIKAWDAGQYELSRTTFESISLAFDAPESVRQRAQYALQVLGPAPEAATPAETQNTPAPAAAQGEQE